MAMVNSFGFLKLKIPSKLLLKITLFDCDFKNHLCTYLHTLLYRLLLYKFLYSFSHSFSFNNENLIFPLTFLMT